MRTQSHVRFSAKRQIGDAEHSKERQQRAFVSCQRVVGRVVVKTEQNGHERQGEQKPRNGVGLLPEFGFYLVDDGDKTPDNENAEENCRRFFYRKISSVPQNAAVAPHHFVQRENHGKTHELEKGYVKFFKKMPPADGMQAEQKRQNLCRQRKQNKQQHICKKRAGRGLRQPVGMQMKGKYVECKANKVAVPDVYRAAEYFADCHFERRHGSHDLKRPGVGVDFFNHRFRRQSGAPDICQNDIKTDGNFRQERKRPGFTENVGHQVDCYQHQGHGRELFGRQLGPGVSDKFRIPKHVLLLPSAFQNRRF